MYSWGKAVVEKVAQGKQNFSVIMWSSCSLCIKIYKVSRSDILSLSETTNLGNL